MWRFTFQRARASRTTVVGPGGRRRDRCGRGLMRGRGLATPAAMKLFLPLTAIAVLVAAHAADVLPFKDDFSDPKLAARRALRGDWKFSGNVATCTQDDELYKKHLNHGPILFYDLAHTDSTVRFAFKPEGAKTFVFTANAEGGHVFRVIVAEKGTSVRAFPADAKDHASISLGQEKPVLKSGEWVPVEVALRGTKATVKIGADFEKTYEHASLARPKTNVSIGFSFGSLAVRDFSVAQ